MTPVWLIGVDVGGTFTDLVAVDHRTGEVRVAKVPTVSDDQSIGIRDGLGKLGTDVMSGLAQLIHGTTVATNAVIERKGARTAVVTTAGFRDVLELRRRDRPRAYGLQGTFEPLVPRWRRYEIAERIDAEGRIVHPIDLERLQDLAKEMLNDGVLAVAICLINSYANGDHERAVGAELRRLWPNSYVSLSHEVLPEIREFERMSTTVLNAYVQPLVSDYLARVEAQLVDMGAERELLIVKSNGALSPAPAVRRLPVTTLLSGPAAGVVAGTAIGRFAGGINVITCDMGGTSLDVCLVAGDHMSIKNDTYLDFGIQCGIPMADIHTVGAGGGSIAHLGMDGILQVGPESAGAVPGPAAYGRGGLVPTLTDAHVVLGRIGGEGSMGLGGHIQPNVELAADAIRREIANPLGLTEDEAGEAIIRVANTAIASSLRQVSIEQGYDPRDLTLVAFGGAGPMHAAAMLLELGIRKVVIPRFPGNTSALGCLLGETGYDFVQTVRRPLDAVLDILRTTAEGQVEQGTSLLAGDGFSLDRVRIVTTAELSYRAQTHTVPVNYDPRTVTIDEMRTHFEREYARRFGRIVPGAEVTVMTIRSMALGIRDAMSLEWFAPQATRAVRPIRLQRVHIGGKSEDVAVFDRASMPVGCQLSGPAIIEQPDSTVFLEEGVCTEVDRAGSIVMTAI